jgi:N-acyl-D-amino-acid deacylase
MSAMLAKAAGLALTGSLLLAATAGAQAPARRFDVILRGGTILDGTGAAARVADLGVIGDHIAAIGDLKGATAKTTIDATGLYVAPGFINVHSHATVEAVPTAANMLFQGVTTEMMNPDGKSQNIDISAQFATFSAGGLAENLGAYVGFNTVWQTVMGETDHRPTADEITRMRALVVDNLQKGVFGVSGGLDFQPGYFAKESEVVAVLSAAAPWRTNFPSHERLTPELGFSSTAGMAETLRIGEAAGVSPEITHIKVQGHEQGRAAQIIAMMSAADARGHYAPSDVYPYLAGQTNLSDYFVPLWAQDGGVPAMLKRIKDPEIRARIIADSERSMNARFGGPSGVYLYDAQRELTDYMREWNVGAGEAVMRLVEKDPEVGAILRFGAEADLRAFLQNPTTAVSCDCGADLAERTHPRYFGSFPRVLGRYTRDEKLLTWPQAVRKMTALPASIVGLVDRGVLAPGMAADITVFDPTTIIDNATYEKPAQLATGVRHVLVNGVPVLSDAKLTGAKPGRTLLRTGQMPTRPLALDTVRSASAKGSLPGKVSINFSASQAPGQAAKGRFQLVDTASGFRIDTRDIGFVQANGTWASFVGTAKTAQGEKRFTVMLDRSSPLDPQNRPTVSVQVEGGYRLDRLVLTGASSVETASPPL